MTAYTEWQAETEEADDLVTIMVDRVELLRPSPYPQSVALLHGTRNGRRVAAGCDIRAARDVFLLLADNDGRPVPCAVPSWSLL